MPAQNAEPPSILIEGLAARLAPLLEPRGLTVTVREDGMIQVANPAGYAADPRGRALSPGLEQCVTAVECDGRLWWAWLWTNRNGPPDIELMLPVDEIDEAVRRIANVLRVEEPSRAER